MLISQIFLEHVAVIKVTMYEYFWKNNNVYQFEHIFVHSLLVSLNFTYYIRLSCKVWCIHTLTSTALLCSMLPKVNGVAASDLTAGTGYKSFPAGSTKCHIQFARDKRKEVKGGGQWWARGPGWVNLEWISDFIFPAGAKFEYTNTVNVWKHTGTHTQTQIFWDPGGLSTQGVSSLMYRIADCSTLSFRLDLVSA